MDAYRSLANVRLVRCNATYAAALLAAWIAPGVARAATPCANLAAPPGSTLTVRQIVTGSVTPPGGFPITGLPTFCRVQATLRPTPQSNVRLELWMPVSGWNGRLLGTGNGGYGGSI